MQSKIKPNEIGISRIYDAPVNLVWEAWIDPKKVAQWWGPRGFTLTTQNKDVRAGGRWIYTMHGPDGVNYPNNTLFHEVEKYSKLVYDHGANEDQPALFKVTVFFTEINGKTQMDMTMSLPTAEAATEIKKFIKLAGGDSTWDRLAEFLSAEIEKKDIFVINRSFDAPLDLVFNQFTDAQHFSKWIAPAGFTTEFIKSDIKTGGQTFYCMKGPITMYAKSLYQDISKPNRIVYTQYFCDEKENTIRPAFAPTWPEALLTKITFSEESPQKTRVTLHAEVAGEATEIEHNTFSQAKSSLTQGWTGSFDQLEEYLLKIKDGSV